MKIRPSQLTDPKAVRAHEQARAIIDTIDKMVDACRQADGSSSDRNPRPGEVAISNLLVDRRATFSDIPIDVASSETSIEQGVLLADSSFRAQVSLPGMWGILPIGLEAEVSRRETRDKVIYDQKYESGVSGAKRFKITVDKQTGDIDFRQYFDRFGIIRKPVT